jgi:hypothetical protein
VVAFEIDDCLSFRHIRQLRTRSRHIPHRHQGSQEVAFEIDGLHSSSFHYSTSPPNANANQTLSSTQHSTPTRTSLHSPNSLTATLYTVNPLLTHRRRFSGRSYSQNNVHRCVILLIFRPSIVRFRLPLTPSHGTEMPPKSTLYRDVGTKDSSPDILKVNRSTSKWTTADLRLLSVNYQYRIFDDIWIGTEDGDMPSEPL